MPGGAGLTASRLETLEAGDLAALGALNVTAQQEVAGGSFAETLDAWQAGPADQVLVVDDMPTKVRASILVDRF